MYVVGKGHDHIGPGTSMVQRINWTTGEEMRMSGLGCGGSCGCSDCSKGLGIFDSMDFTTWGIPEWGLVVLGVFAVGSMFSTTKRGVQSVRSSGRRRKSGAKKRRDLEYRRAKVDRDLADL